MIERAATVQRSFAEDVRRGLTQPQKELHPWYFYDALGSALFAAICELPEYYVTRAETEILQRYASSIAHALGAVDRIVELGSGDARKTRLILQTITRRFTYVPIDVDRSVLDSIAHDFRLDFPDLRVNAICGDYREIASLIAPASKTVVLFLGSSIGNLDPISAAAMLREVRSILTPGDALFLGADLRKPKSILEPAYNDALGVTASFNLNLLARINRELGGHFDLTRFEHRAFFNERESRIEMHLVSRRKHSVAIDSLGIEVPFEAGETIHTENSYKYSEPALQTLAREGGFEIEQLWTDSHGWFADVLMAGR